MKHRIVSVLICVTILLPLLVLPTFAEGSILVDGRAVAFAQGQSLSALCDLSTRRLIYAEVTHTDGSVETVTDPEVALFDVTSIRTHRLSLIACGEGELRDTDNSTGLRFVTSVSEADLLRLLEDPNIASVALGTVILPVNLAVEAAELTHATLGETPHLDVKASTDAWYKQVSSVCYFAGSIIEIKPQNYTREFVGRGYAAVTFQSGACVTVYAGGASYAVATYGSMASEWLLEPDNEEASEAVRAHFLSVTEQMYGTALEGLNVLAIGDSLFHGHTLEDDQTWIALLAERYRWNLTNLGRDGWTVAKNDAAYPEGATIRHSMYDHLMNDSDYAYGSTAGYYTTGDAKQKTAADVDIILLEGGTNDFGWGLPLGDVTDPDAMQRGDNYLGALDLMIQRLKVLYPNATVVLVTSWHITGTSYGQSRMDFVSDGMKALYNASYATDDRVLLMDAGNPDLNGGIRMAEESFRALYACTPKDLNHLNVKGMQMMANGTSRLLWELLGD